MPEAVEMSPRLKSLFRKTKLLCIGRYALEVPAETQINWGEVWFPSDVKVYSGDLNAAKQRAEKRIAELKWLDDTAEIIYKGDGPVDESWQVRYYKRDTGKEFGLLFFDTYVTRGEVTFLFEDGTANNEREARLVERQAQLAKSLRLRAPDEVPATPGLCIQHGFLASDRYDTQEMVSAGLYLPSLPDVTFSISSNKDAYSAYPPAEFDSRMRPKLSLLNRIRGAQDAQGSNYPSRTLLREGKRDVQHWHGEESLLRRPDGVHDFEWALVGTPREVANPSEYMVSMRTKVAYNMVGAAKAASLSDDEAVALWDKLLSGLKFRVKVPGAPAGSYHFDKAGQ